MDKCEAFRSANSNTFRTARGIRIYINNARGFRLAAYSEFYGRPCNYGPRDSQDNLQYSINVAEPLSCHRRLKRKPLVKNKVTAGSGTENMLT